MNWTVYILECADGSLYTGITKDLTRRITKHETGKGARYTDGRGPFRLVCQEFQPTRLEATKREAAIKAMTRADKLALITKVMFTTNIPSV
ncbi:MAG: GIY-YIG nuclease family protein [Nitrosomonas sp.]|nr:GIY-YIG nuclease family protein [Nitrosomonas sp.]